MRLGLEAPKTSLLGGDTFEHVLEVGFAENLAYSLLEVIVNLFLR